MSAPQSPTSERWIIGLVALGWFVNVLDFMIVMPLGPDFARDLDIPLAHLGIIGGSYTAAAAVAGLFGSLWLDRFARRPALVVAFVGLAIATIGAIFAQNLATLMAARILAGLFGGPASSLTLSVVADVIPAERRGRAMGIIMSSFSIASIAGVPLSLELARLGSWHTPFILTGGLAVLVALAARRWLPRLDGHLATPQTTPALGAVLELGTRPAVLVALAMAACTMMGQFVVVPNLAAFVQGNMGFPRNSLSFAYFYGGAASLLSMNIGGRAVDKLGPVLVGALATLLLLTVQYSELVHLPPLLPVYLFFVFFMASTSLRAVAFNTMASKVPAPHERARFMSLQSATQHAASAVGAFVSSQLLSENGLQLVGMEKVGMVAIGMSVLVPLFMLWLDRLAPAKGGAPAAAVVDSAAEAPPVVDAP